MNINFIMAMLCVITEIAPLDNKLSDDKVIKFVLAMENLLSS